MIESGSRSKIGIGIGDLLPHVGHLRLRLLVWRDRGTDLPDLQCRIISRDAMRPCMRDEMKMYVVEEGVGIGVGKEIKDISVVVAKWF